MISVTAGKSIHAKYFGELKTYYPQRITTSQSKFKQIITKTYQKAKWIQTTKLPSKKRQSVFLNNLTTMQNFN